MKTAKEMKQVSIKNDLKNIMTEIKTASKAGKTEVTIWHIPDDAVRVKLYNLGYDIETFKGNNDKCTIKWSL